MARPRILVAEGNAADIRERTAALSGYTPGEGYAAVLRSLAPEIEVDICRPADRDDVPASLDAYAGIAITGSALNAYHAVPAVLRQVEFARAAFASGRPFFGSCWGLQIAAIAAGGTVALNDRGREVGYSRNLHLTHEGRSHPMHRGRPPAFDAPAIHSDHVTVLPEGMLVTASNETSPVQAAEIRHGGGVFWGVQYHPGFALNDIADVVTRYGARLVDAGFFSDGGKQAAYCARLRALAADPARTDIAWQLALGPDITDPPRRLVEIRNWLGHALGSPNEGTSP